MEQIRMQGGDADYQEAFASLRAAKNWFFWLLCLALVLSLASFGVMRFWPGIVHSPTLQKDVPRLAAQGTNQPTTGPATRPSRGSAPDLDKAADEVANAEYFYTMMAWVLPVAKTVGLVRLDVADADAAGVPGHGVVRAAGRGGPDG